MITLPQSAQAHLKVQRRETHDALSATKRQWRRMGADFDASWALIVGPLVGITATAQRRIAEDSFDYIPTVLDERGYAERIDMTVRPQSAPLVGVTGSGTAVDESFYAAVITAKIAVDRGMTVPQALHRGETRLMQRASLALSDTGRFAERVALAPARVTYYQRALSLPSCSRCVILAGRLYRMEQAFQRHPQCDCRHLPVGEVGEAEEVDPHDYFASLDEAEQDRIFTKAGAEAIRGGADMNQVVNARRGMYTSRTGSRQWKFTREGTTRRGWYGRSQRGTGARRRRLMPEEIQRLASSKDDYLHLLKMYGYF